MVLLHEDDIKELLHDDDIKELQHDDDIKELQHDDDIKELQHGNRKERYGEGGREGGREGGGWVLAVAACPDSRPAPHGPTRGGEGTRFRGQPRTLGERDGCRYR
jgi:hypothetical protein